MPQGHLCELQEGYCKGCYKAAAAACGCAGDDEVYHLLTCHANRPLAYLDMFIHCADLLISCAVHAVQQAKEDMRLSLICRLNGTHISAGWDSHCVLASVCC